MIQLRQHWRSAIGVFVISAGLTFGAWIVALGPPQPAAPIENARPAIVLPMEGRVTWEESYRPDGVFFVAGHTWSLCQTCRKKE